MPEITPDTAARLESTLRTRLVDPDNSDSSLLWGELSKGLPDLAHMPLFLLQAWGKLPLHYNYLLDRAEYDADDSWSNVYASEVAALTAAAQKFNETDTSVAGKDLSFFTIDAVNTQDIDDACHFKQRPDGGWSIRLAFACPALAWPFGSDLDKAVMHRASSIYLPEATMHMLPLSLGTDVYSLKAGKHPALLLSLELDSEAEVESAEFSLACAHIAANLAYEECGAALNGDAAALAGPVGEYVSELRQGLVLADKLKQWRLKNGAVIIERNDPEIVLRETDGDTVVEVYPALENTPAQNIVGELMLLANTVTAQWAAARGVPLIHRTQDVAVPQEYCGVWKEPHEISRVVKVLPQASLAVQPRPHAGVGTSAYATVTSPLRRYCDLINEAQILSFLSAGTPHYDAEQLSHLTIQLSARLDVVLQVQRYRPRYWKLLFLKQQGNRSWHEAVVVDETDSTVFLSLLRTQIILRGKRALFGDRVDAGQHWMVRVGKINPASNDIQILEARAKEELE
jgi:exoribonuclease-2